MNMLDEYISNIKKMKLSLQDFGDASKVKKSNMLADRNIIIAETINTEESNLKIQFAGLLDTGDYDTKQWVAHHILERMTFDSETRKKALKVIESIAENSQSPIEKMGNAMWLKDYYNKHPEDMDL